MNGKGHRMASTMAMDVFTELQPELDCIHTRSDGRGLVELSRGLVINYAVHTDHFRDVEFVDVNAITEDEHHFGASGRNFTSFNHFIDIKKGPGRFDDFDGYSYRRGSACKGEYQHSTSVTKNWEWVAARAADMQVDEGIAWWLNDEYVHVLGKTWSGRPSSPAMLAYSYFQDAGKYDTKEQELRARFPGATSIGGAGKGVPYSVFMPVDNLGRSFFESWVAHGNAVALGSVLHAVQDCTIPHHAAGYMGNWHSQYESELDAELERWLPEEELAEEIKGLVRAWNWEDPNPPTQLTLDERGRTPAINWRIDHLITWVALHAYHVYAEVYGHFRDFSPEMSAIKFEGWSGFTPEIATVTRLGTSLNRESLRQLTVLGIAMSVIALIKANKEVETLYVANRRTKEIHTSDCRWLELMSPGRMLLIVKPEEYLATPESNRGYNGCHYCMTEQSRTETGKWLRGYPIYEIEPKE